eukprot:377895-Pelagomonas_calceolata.AAC.12
MSSSVTSKYSTSTCAPLAPHPHLPFTMSSSVASVSSTSSTVYLPSNSSSTCGCDEHTGCRLRACASGTDCRLAKGGVARGGSPAGESQQPF